MTQEIDSRTRSLGPRTSNIVRRTVGRRWRPKPAVLATQLAVLVAIVGAWWLLTVDDRLVQAFLSTPADVATRFVMWMSGPTAIWKDLGQTLVTALLGLVVGAGLACIFGVVLGRMPRLATWLNPFLAVANVVPKVALLPLFLLWLGIGSTSKVVFAATGVFFIVFFNVFASVSSVPVEQREQMRVIGASWLWSLRELYLPYMWGALIASLRLAVAFALLGVVLGEMMAGNSGMGFRLADSQARLAPDGVIVAILLIAVVAATADTLLAFLDRRLARWRQR